MINLLAANSPALVHSEADARKFNKLSTLVLLVEVRDLPRGRALRVPVRGHFPIAMRWTALGHRPVHPPGSATNQIGGGIAGRRPDPAVAASLSKRRIRISSIQMTLRHRTACSFVGDAAYGLRQSMFLPLSLVPTLFKIFDNGGSQFISMFRRVAR